MVSGSLDHKKLKKLEGLCAFTAHSPSSLLSSTSLTVMRRLALSTGKFFKAIDNQKIMHYSIAN